MFYGKGNHIVNCVIYMVLFLFVPILFIISPQNIAVWRMVLISTIYFIFIIVACIGELALRKMKKAKKDAESVEKTRENYMYLVYAMMVIIAATTLTLLRL